MTKEERKQYMSERKRRGQTGATAIHQTYAKLDGKKLGLNSAFIRPKELS